MADTAGDGLEAQSDPLRVLDTALFFAENLRLLVFLPLAAGLLALGISFFIPPTYMAKTRILPPIQHQSLSAALAAQYGSLAGLVSGAAGIKNPAEQYVALLKSRTVFDALVQRFELMDLYDAQYREDASKILDQRTNIYAGQKDGIISIEVEDGDPKRAADLANAFVDQLKTLSKTLAITEAAQRRLFFENQLALAKGNLTKAEIALRSSGVSEATLKVMPQSALEALARLKAQTTAQEIKLASMRAFMTESNPEFRLATRELDALRSELSKLEQATTLKSGGHEYIGRFRDFKYHETLFELIGKQYEMARLDEAREGALVQVIDVATPPERKSKPKKGIIAVVTTLGVFILTFFCVYVKWIVHSAARVPSVAQKMRRLRSLVSLRRP